jgi:hypothetical protein
MKFDKDWIIIALLFVIIGFLSYKIYEINKNTNIQIEKIHQQSEKDNRFTTIYYDQTITSLKQTNKELYDSIQHFKEQIDYLMQFNFQKEYITDTIYCYVDSLDNEDVNVYSYNNKKNDTLNYQLQIASTKEPNWYKLKLGISEEFTIVNKKQNGLNITTIQPTSSGTITDVTVFKQDKTTFWDNIVFGPSITCGCDVINKNFGIMFGVSLTYNIPLNNKK